MQVGGSRQLISLIGDPDVYTVANLLSVESWKLVSYADLLTLSVTLLYLFICTCAFFLTLLLTPQSFQSKIILDLEVKWGNRELQCGMTSISTVNQVEISTEGIGD